MLLNDGSINVLQYYMSRACDFVCIVVDSFRLKRLRTGEQQRDGEKKKIRNNQRYDWQLAIDVQGGILITEPNLEWTRIAIEYDIANKISCESGMPVGRTWRQVRFKISGLLQEFV